MKSVVFECQVPVEKSLELQKLDYEKVTRQNVMTQYLASGGDLKSETYIEYHKELIDCTSKSDLMKLEIYEEFVPEESKDNQDYMWELNYATGKLTVYKK